MKLHELKRCSFFYLADDKDKNQFFFDHIDGMYSVCFNRFQDLVHINCMAEVVYVPHLPDGYEEETDAINLSQFIDIVGIEHG